MTAFASYAGVVVAHFESWPLWQVVTVALLPWIPLLTLEIRWTYRHYGWLALFYFLAITQLGHFIEHLCQLYQIHVMHLKGPEARGVFGQLDIEWVHFFWNSWIIVAAGMLAYRFRRNPWLWMTLFVAGWHEIEHLYIMSVYLRTGQAGTPGLLSDGGVIGGGLPLTRPDLHFVYNLVETAPLVIGFIWQLKRTHDAWLAKAFPRLTEAQLSHITTRVRTVRFAPGDTLVAEGKWSARSYVIVRGLVEVVRNDEGDHQARVTTLGPGRCVGERRPGAYSPSDVSVRAKTAVEALALNRRFVPFDEPTLEASAGAVATLPVSVAATLSSSSSKPLN